jgi:hypothetical protein
MTPNQTLDQEAVAGVVGGVARVTADMERVERAPVAAVGDVVEQCAVAAVR